MKYKLVIVEPAEFDVDEIYRYILRRSTQGAGSWYRAFVACTKRIVRQPLACSIAPEDGKETYDWPVTLSKSQNAPPVSYSLIERNDLKPLLDRVRMDRSVRSGELLPDANHLPDPPKFTSMSSGRVVIPIPVTRRRSPLLGRSLGRSFPLDCFVLRHGTSFTMQYSEDWTRYNEIAFTVSDNGGISIKRP